MLDPRPGARPGPRRTPRRARGGTRWSSVEAFVTSDGTLCTVTVTDLGVIEVEAVEVQLVGFEGRGR